MDATEICQRLLGRNPPPVGLCLLGAYVRITESLDMAELRNEVRGAFAGRVGEANARAAVEAFEGVKAIGGVNVNPDNLPRGFHHSRVEDLTQHYRFDRYDLLPGYRKGSPFVWRDKIPVCQDNKCICPNVCISEVMCPDGTGFIVREGLPQQGYRIDVDFCRGCGICRRGVCWLGPHHGGRRRGAEGAAKLRRGGPWSPIWLKYTTRSVTPWTAIALRLGRKTRQHRVNLSPAEAQILFLTRRVYLTSIGLALMVMFVACGEASPTQTPENSLMERTPVPGVERTEALTDTYRVEVWMGSELTSMMMTTAFPVMSVMDGGRPVNRHIEIHIFEQR